MPQIPFQSVVAAAPAALDIYVAGEPALTPLSIRCHSVSIGPACRSPIVFGCSKSTNVRLRVPLVPRTGTIRQTPASGVM
jgi:hypothetical protein